MIGDPVPKKAFFDATPGFKSGVALILLAIGPRKKKFVYLESEKVFTFDSLRFSACSDIIRCRRGCACQEDGRGAAAGPEYSAQFPHDGPVT